MSVIWYKIWFDLWHNKGRTSQVVLIIAVGTFAVGMALGATNLINQNFSTAWAATHPSMITLVVNPPIDDNMLTSLKSIPGVVAVDGELSNESIKWRRNSSEAWHGGNLIARDDYHNQTLNQFLLKQGNWPERHTLLVEQGFDLPIGLPLQIEIHDKARDFTLSGLTSNPAAMPPFFGGDPIFYTTRARFTEMTGQTGYNKIRVTAALYNEATVSDLADHVQNHLERQGIETTGAGDLFGNRLTAPTRYPLQDIIDGISFILVGMGVMSMLLGLFLVFNTMMAIISQQVNQIGIMKAIGASWGRILFIYYSNVLMYGLLALLIALPSGAWAAQALNNFMLYLFNLDPTPFRIVPLVFAIQTMIALLLPLLAATWPILTGANITVREAIGSYGLGGTAGLLERLLAHWSFMPQLLALTVSNTFRNRKRVALTLAALVGSGTIFMMVITTQKSAAYSFDEVMLATFHFDVTLEFEADARIAQVESLALSQPNIEAAEMWSFKNTVMRATDSPQTKDKSSKNDFNTFLVGLPLPTTFYVPEMKSGRWLLPSDQNAVVLHYKLADKAGVTLGDWITFDHGPQGKSNWQVVGILSSTSLGNMAFVSRESLLKITHNVGKTNTLWVRTRAKDALSQTAAAEQLTSLYENKNLKVKIHTIFGPKTSRQIADDNVEQIGAIISLLGLMAVVTALVGSIALSGVLSINVLERQREIGVMRAIGASSMTIARLFIGEGLILGLLSWLIAWPLSLPIGRLMTIALGAAIQNDVTYVYSMAGVWYWLAIVLILSTLASGFPAWKATRISVRECLMYQ